MKKRFEIVIKPIPPFDFDSTVYVPHHFPTPDFQWQPNLLWKTFNFHRNQFGLKMANNGTTDKPKVKLTIYSEKTLSEEETDEVLEELNWRYGLDEDISEFFTEFKEDRFLKPVFRRLRGMRSSCSNSLYELLIISVVLQNATVRRTVQMMNNLLDAYGTRLKFDNKDLLSFWRPEDLKGVSEEELKSLKVGYRAKMIRLVSVFFAEGKIDESSLKKKSTEDARKELMKLYGVGPATAQNILSEYLRRYTVLDLKGKLWEQKIISRVMFEEELVLAQEITETFERRYGKWKWLAFYYVFTEVFWKHKERRIPWLEREIRL
jgi:3-methyladenine DNA glycosylase/8-oxoguanine DNA glycosylase